MRKDNQHHQLTVAVCTFHVQLHGNSYIQHNRVALLLLEDLILKTIIIITEIIHLIIFLCNIYMDLPHMFVVGLKAFL